MCCAIESLETGVSRSRLCVQISHGNTAAHAAEYGDKQLGRICAAIAGDEARHEKAYIKITDEIFRLCVPFHLLTPPSDSACSHHKICLLLT